MCTLFIVIIIYFIYNIHSYIFSTELSNFLRHFREGLNRQNPPTGVRLWIGLSLATFSYEYRTFHCIIMRFVIREYVINFLFNE